MIFVHIFVVRWLVRDCPAGDEGGADKDVVALCDNGGGWPSSGEDFDSAER